jgi:hypothetical protein
MPQRRKYHLRGLEVGVYTPLRGAYLLPTRLPHVTYLLRVGGVIFDYDTLRFHIFSLHIKHNPTAST